MEKYRVAYTIDEKLKFKSINAKNEKTLNKVIQRKFHKVKSFSMICYMKMYDFNYGLFNDISKGFVKSVSGDTPQEVIKRMFKILGNDARKQRYRIKPFDLTKEDQAIYNQKIQEFDKEVLEVLQKNE